MTPILLSNKDLLTCDSIQKKYIHKKHPATARSHRVQVRFWFDSHNALSDVRNTIFSPFVSTGIKQSAGKHI